VSIALIVGLGNPSPQYVATRHNAGFWLVDNLANEPFHTKAKFYGSVCRVEIPQPTISQRKKPLTSPSQDKKQSATLSEKAELHDEKPSFLRRLGLFTSPKKAKQAAPISPRKNGEFLTCWLLKPNTFMNRSGQAVAALVNYYQIPPQQILVIHDDLDFPPGKVRLKQGGGDGRHNGLKSIIAQLGSNQFLRLRLGIGHPGRSEDVTGYVLNAPTRDEQIEIEAAMSAALEVMPLIVAGEVNKAMQQLHSK